MYHVFGPVTTRTFRVLWALEELGQPYQLTQAAPRSAEVAALNPTGKVPAMTDNGIAITDSSAIMLYLADKHAALMAPAGTLERAQQDAMFHRVLDEIDAVLWTAARHSFILPEEERVPDIKPALKVEFNRNITRLAGDMGDEFAVGNSFSLVDILLTHCLNWAFSAKFDYDSDAMKAYAKRMRARSAFQRVAEQRKT